MKRSSFSSALRATAKIACATSILQLSCKNKTPNEVATPVPGTEASSDVQSTNEVLPPIEVATPKDAVTINTNQNTDRGEPTKEAFESCQPIIESTFANDARLEEVPTEVRDCCALTAAYYDALSFKTDVSNVDTIGQWKYRYECCEALEWRGGSMACTPWGPPTPPSAHRMKRRIIVPVHVHKHQNIG